MLSHLKIIIFQELLEIEGEDECKMIQNSERFKIKPLGDQIKDTIMTTLLPEAEKWSGVKLTGKVVPACQT